MTAMAGKVDPVYQHGGLAIRGYDAVVYYQQSAPVKGSSQFKYQWRGATWLFASAENRDLFQADPERYAPQYGGYCAYAVSKGRTASIDPEAWKIVDGKLYLNYSKGVQKKWEEDVPGNIVKADKNWPDLHR
jgi:YHS domain-containing protein